MKLRNKCVSHIKCFFWYLAEKVGKRLLFLLANGDGMLALVEGFGTVASLRGLHLKSA